MNRDDDRPRTDRSPGIQRHIPMMSGAEADPGLMGLLEIVIATTTALS